MNRGFATPPCAAAAVSDGSGRGCSSCRRSRVAAPPSSRACSMRPCMPCPAALERAVARRAGRRAALTSTGRNMPGPTTACKPLPTSLELSRVAQKCVPRDARNGAPTRGRGRGGTACSAGGRGGERRPLRVRGAIDVSCPGIDRLGSRALMQQVRDATSSARCPAVARASPLAAKQGGRRRPGRKAGHHAQPVT